jgi:hypothetical protein
MIQRKGDKTNVGWFGKQSQSLDRGRGLISRPPLAGGFCPGAELAGANWKIFLKKGVDFWRGLWYTIIVKGSKGRAVPTDECADTCPLTNSPKCVIIHTESEVSDMEPYKGYTLGCIVVDLLICLCVIYPIINWLVKWYWSSKKTLDKSKDLWYNKSTKGEGKATTSVGAHESE